MTVTCHDCGLSVAAASSPACLAPAVSLSLSLVVGERSDKADQVLQQACSGKLGHIIILRRLIKVWRQFRIAMRSKSLVIVAYPMRPL
jgi:hypothetical protein